MGWVSEKDISDKRNEKDKRKARYVCEWDSLDFRDKVRYGKMKKKVGHSRDLFIHYI